MAGSRPAMEAGGCGVLFRSSSPNPLYWRQISFTGLSMIAFLRWLRSLFAGVLTSIARTIAFLVMVVVVVLIVALVRGDGLPGNIVLTADLRQSLADSAT